MRPRSAPDGARQTPGHGFVFEEHPPGRSSADRISLLQPVVFLVLSGRTDVDWTDGRSTASRVVGPGGFSLLPAQSPYSVRLRSTGTTALVSFPDWELPPEQCPALPWVHGAEDTSVRELVMALRSLPDPSSATATEGSGLGEALQLHLLRRFGRERAPREHPARTGGLPAAVLAQALRFIEEHLEGPLAVSDIAAAVGLSESHFARRFKASLGLPPHRHLLRRRVALAKSLLARGLPAAETALRSGFCDQPHFCRCFREIEGTTPSRFVAARAGLNRIEDIEEILALEKPTDLLCPPAMRG